MRFAFMLVVIFVGMRQRLIIVAAVVMITMTVIKRDDLSRAVAVTKVATHDPKHLRPPQREQRKGNEHG